MHGEAVHETLAARRPHARDDARIYRELYLWKDAQSILPKFGKEIPWTAKLRARDEARHKGHEHQDPSQLLVCEADDDLAELETLVIKLERLQAQRLFRGL